MNTIITLLLELKIFYNFSHHLSSLISLTALSNISEV